MLNAPSIFYAGAFSLMALAGTAAYAVESKPSVDVPQDKSTDAEYVPKEEYTKLKREVEVLKAQMLLLIERLPPPEQDLKPEEPSSTSQAKMAPPETQGLVMSSQAAADQHAVERSQTNENKLDIAEAAEDPPAEERSQTKEDNLDVAEGSREKEAEESRRELDTFLRNRIVLYKRGDLSLEFDLAYTQNTTVNTFGFAPPTNSLNTTAKMITRSVDSSVTMRYGLADDLEFDLIVPFGYLEQKNDNQPFHGDSPPVSHINTAGIGDISGAIRYTAFTERGSIPSTTLSLHTSAPTGDFKTGMGSGFWSVGGGVSLVKTIDPVVFFGSLGYTGVLEDRGINPGNQFSYSIGAGFSMNDRVSFSTSLNGAIVSRFELHGRERAGSARDVHILQLKSTIQLTKRLFVEPFVGIGLTDDAPDFLVGLRVPYRFEQQFPLPFFSE